MGWTRTLGIGLGASVGVGLLAFAGLAWRADTGAFAPPDASGLVDVEVDGPRVADALSQLIRLPTITPVAEGEVDWREPVVDASGEAVEPAWIRLLRDRFLTEGGWRTARVGRGLAVFVDSPDERPPVLWLSHVDVVPVSDPDRWTHPPFEGVVEGGIVYGRGALDNKASVIAQLEALRLMTQAGRAPSRDLVLLITPDEEVSGDTARAAAEDLAVLGHPEVVIDEGSYLLPDLFPGTLVGAVAVSEKTFVNYAVTARGEDRHSSMPRPPSAVDELTNALHRLATWDSPSALPEPLVVGLRRAAPTRPFLESVVLGNADLLGFLVKPLVQRSPAGNAVTRDTVAATIVRAGVKDNVIPGLATANVNARLRPETEPERFLEILREVMGDGVEVTLDGAWTRGGPGRWNTETFAALERVIPAVAPGVVVIPSVTPGTMDARYFAAAGLETYRFHPFLAPAELRATLHGTDERLPVEELVRGVRFYQLLAQAL